MDSKALYIAGTRTFSAEVADYARDAGIEPAGLLEPFDRDRVGTDILGLPVTWLEDTEAPAGATVVIGTGQSNRREVAERLQAAGWPRGTLIHPTAHLAPSAEVGAGSIVAPRAVVGAMTRIGENVVLGRGSLVGHHTEIEDLATIGPGSNVAGNTTIGAAAFLGMSAVVRDHVRVGEGATVAMGSVVVGDVPAGARVRGLPASEF
jgi:sugar O-acyltransferase (sialic acid O-acetyltransferase NeuD family)